MLEKLAIKVPRHLRIPAACTAFVFFMVGMSFAAVPLYDLFCRVTGFAGTTQIAEAASDRVLDQTIYVRFDGNVSGKLPWQFGPETSRVKLKIGETGQMIYLAQNLSDQTTAGSSTFNVSPPQAGIYFNKLECFCFTEQPLAPGETAEMPVVFFVDPAILDDKNTREVGEITLSYTFFPVNAPEAPLAAGPDLSSAEPL